MFTSQFSSRPGGGWVGAPGGRGGPCPGGGVQPGGGPARKSDMVGWLCLFVYIFIEKKINFLGRKTWTKFYFHIFTLYMGVIFLTTSCFCPPP